jgi:serine/threonine-protein kinase
MGDNFEHIGRHRVVERLAGYGREVFLTQRDDGSKALLALFDVDDATAKQLEEAAATCLALSDSHIAHVVELFPFEKHRAVVFDDVQGLSLAAVQASLRDQDEQLTDGALLYVGLGMCRGLGAAHTATDEEGKVTPLVHSQLGAHQVFVSFSGDVKVLGLGLGPIFKLQTDAKKLPATALRHAAPEVKRGGPVTARANTFSAASILWSMLTLEDPPEDALYPKLDELRPDLPTKLKKTIDGALEPVVLRRTVTCQQLASTIADSGLADRQELLWNIEILRRVPEETSSAYPLDSLPPTSEPTIPSPDSEMPTGIYQMLSDREDDDTEKEEVDEDEEWPTVVQQPRSNPALTDDVDAAWGEPDDVDAAWGEPDDIDDASDSSSPPPSEKPRTTLEPGEKILRSKPAVRMKPGQLVMPGTSTKPLPPVRAPMATMRGLADSSVSPDADAAAPEPKEEAPETEEEHGVADDAPKRASAKRDEAAQRRTMRLASNVAGAPLPDATSLRAAKPPVVDETSSDGTAERVDAPEHVGALETSPASPPAPSSSKTAPAPTPSSPERPASPPAPSSSKTAPAPTPSSPERPASPPAPSSSKTAPAPSPSSPELPGPPTPRGPGSTTRTTSSATVRMSNQQHVAAAQAVAAQRQNAPAVPVLDPGPAPEPPTRSYDRLFVIGLATFVGALGLAGGVALGRCTASPVAPESRRSPPPEPGGPEPASHPGPRQRTTGVATETRPAPSTSAPATPDDATTYLDIDTTQTDAHVYLDGKPVAPLTDRVAVPCGVHNVRLGTFPLTKWLTKGKSFKLPCGGTLELTMEPYYAGTRLNR